MSYACIVLTPATSRRIRSDLELEGTEPTGLFSFATDTLDVLSSPSSIALIEPKFILSHSLADGAAAILLIR